MEKTLTLNKKLLSSKHNQKNRALKGAWFLCYKKFI